jgi:hypothetical protein
VTDAASQVLELARKFELPIDEIDAELLVSNRARLAANPKDPEALAIEKHFMCDFYWAKEELAMADFIGDPQCEPGCPYCFAHDQRASRRLSERFGRIGACGA